MEKLIIVHYDFRGFDAHKSFTVPKIHSAIVCALIASSIVIRLAIVLQQLRCLGQPGAGESLETGVPQEGVGHQPTVMEGRGGCLKQ